MEKGVAGPAGGLGLERSLDRLQALLEQRLSQWPETMPERSQMTPVAAFPGQDQAPVPVMPEGTRRFSRKPCVYVDRYDGTTPWTDYKAHFETCAELNGWDDIEKANFLAASLKGRAQQILSGWRREKGYVELVKLLHQQFGPGQHAEMFLAELRGKQRKPDESLQQLGMEIRRLAALAYPELSEEARDRLSRTHFADALDSKEVRVALFQAHSKSLDEAVAIATEVASYLEVEKVRPGARGVTRHARAVGEQGMSETSQMREELEKLREEIKTLRRGGRR